MKTFKPTYLYIKTHNVTGLKYFGKTTSNRKRYRGSGHYWVRHIKKHGYDVTTEILGYFTDQDECMNFAIDFSVKNDIVNSSLWANERIENGLDGGDTTTQKSENEIKEIVAKRKQAMDSKTPEELEEIRQKNSEGVKKYIDDNPEARQQAALKIRNSRKNNGQAWHSEETIEKIKQNNKAGTPEVRQKLREANLGKKNPEHSKRMSMKTGLLNKNTRVFELTAPTNETIQIIGVGNVREYCKDNEIAFDQIFKHLNKGKIEVILAKTPRPSMNKCLGYEIKEIDRNT